MLSPALVLPSVALALLLGPPVQSPQTGEQAPAISPTQPNPGEAAIAPAHVEGDRAVTEPAVGEPVDPEPTPDPQPTTEPELPSWQSDPIAPVEGPTEATETPVVVDEWGTPLPPPEKPIPPRGTGFFIGAGALFGVMVIKQLALGLTCEDVYCGYRGNLDRGLGLGVMGLTAGGGWFQGRRAAFLNHDAGKPAKPLTSMRAGGWTLFVIGLGGLIADTVLYNVCYSSADGPYTKIEGFTYTCSPTASVVVVDFSTLIGAVGMGMGMSAENQRRHQKKYAMSLAPWGGRGQAGLSLSGRF
jgi:hypothetical protein